ncbi:MAG: leucine-rich repeat domain-containing protein, partial [Bacteroidaceae bacterium]|nr:leucine-rich repeat domain-containing protein [Bacteroidaceae bacterium]
LITHKMYTLKLFLSILSMTFLPLTMQGQEAIHGVCGLYGDNVLWDLKGDTLFISGRGDMANYEWNSSQRSAPWNAYRAQIKCVIVEDSVTSIGEYAFQQCEKLTTVRFPQSLKKICKGAFWECTNMDSITFPDSVYIGGQAFYRCISLHSITFPEHLLELGGAAFWNCASLDSIRIPNTITTLKGTFAGCTSLRYVEIPNSVKTLEGTVFANCSSLKSIQIPNSVKTLGGEVFKGCTDLDSIVIPNSVTDIGIRAFEDCTHLKSVKLSEKLTSIPSYVFRNCSSLTSIEIPEGVTAIGDYTFAGCEALSTIIISKNVSNIGYYAFYNCMGIKDFFCYPAIMPKIFENAFDNYMYWPLQATLHVPKNLMNEYSVTKPWTTFERLAALPDAIDKGNNSTAYYTLNNEEQTASVTSGLEKYVADVIIPGRIMSNGKYYNVTSVENFSFLNCEQLTSVSLSNSIKYVGRFAFADCPRLEKVKLPSSITAIEDYTFSNCISLFEIEIPGKVTSIGEGAFVGCSNLESISLPNKTTSIGMRAFADCSSLTSVQLNDKLEVIDDNAFEECKSLTSVTIPNSMTLLGSNAFKDCTSLKAVTFDGCAGEICQDAFSGCTGLKDIYSYSDVPPAADEYAFEGSNYDATLHVSAASLEAYQSTAPWCYFKHIIPHEEAAYGGIVFQYEYNTEDLTATLVKVTFSDNTNEERLVIPAELQVEGKTYKVTTIEEGAISSYQRSFITSIELPRTLRTLERNTISVSEQLKTIRIMGDIEKIDDYAFVAALYNGLGLINCSLNDFYCYASFVPELSPLAFNGHASRIKSDDDIAEFEDNGRTSYLPRYFTFNWWEMGYNEDGAFTQIAYHTDTKYQYYLIEHATLHVPAYLVESYKQTFPWNMFGNIVALTEEETKIKETPSDSPSMGREIVNLNGQRITTLQKGLNIVDGKKVFLK